MIKKIVFILILFAGFLILSATGAVVSAPLNDRIDSIQTLLQADKPDTNKVNHLNELSWEYRNLGSYDTALASGAAALQLAQKLLERSGNPAELRGIKKGVTASLNNIGVVYFYLSDYPKVHPVERDSLLNRALDYYFIYCWIALVGKSLLL